SYEELRGRLEGNAKQEGFQIRKIDPLFKSEEEYEEFKARHNRFNIKELDPKEYVGDAYLGIDAGSTTTKAIVLSEDNEVVYSYYGNNKGKPLDQAVYILKDIYNTMPDVNIKYSCVTGYGEDFIKAGLGVDEGEVETMAHYKGASLFQEDVDFI